MMHRNSRWLPRTTMCLAVVLIASVHTCLAQTSTPQLLRVKWEYDVKTPLNATVGDTIEFTWATASYHDVFIYPSGNCDDETGAIPVYPYATVGGAVNYTFTANDTAPGGKAVFFACQVGEGIHCRFNVNQLVIVYPNENTISPTGNPVTTSAPTATPTLNAVPTTEAPSSTPSQNLVTSFPYGGSLAPSMVPTSLMNGTTAVPTVSVPLTTAPSNATSFPSAIPVFPTMAPSTPVPSLAPTVVASAAPSAVSMLSLAPSLEPSFSTAPSLLPSSVPTGTPSIATPSPTTSVMKTSLLGLEMTLFGTSTMSQEDIANWESVTSLYQTSYYADGTSGVLDLEATLKVTSSTRRRLEDVGASDVGAPSVTLIYNQNMTYRLSDPQVTPAVIVSTPFATEELRDEYVNLYLNNVGDTSVLTNVTTVSPVEGDAVEGNSTPPPNQEEEEPLKKDDNGGLSGGAIAGIAVASLVACVLCCLLTAQRHERENEWDEEEENPYIPPSPANFENFAATDKSVEHAFFQD